jgi:hypothetical protein
MTMTDLETLPNIAGWWLVSPGRTPEQLSPRERQILDLVTGGRSSKEVAFDLGVSDATVRVLQAVRGSVPEDLSLGDFMRRCETYFAAEGCIIDQPFQPRFFLGRQFVQGLVFGCRKSGDA